MSSGPSYANLDSREGSLNGSLTITFKFKPRKIIITNDSASLDLGFKFNTSEATATLAPTETVSLEFASKTLILSANGADYRVWGIG
jgi:hypothetical protein